MGTERAYERSAVEAFVRAAASERVRLQLAIAEAEQRAVAARAAEAADRSSFDANLEEQVAEIAQHAEAQVAVQLADAEREVALLREAAERLEEVVARS